MLKKKTENQSIAAAVLHQRAIGPTHADAGEQADQHAAQWHRDVPVQQMPAPAPERPERERPGRPGEPDQFLQQCRHLCARAVAAEPPGPGVDQQCGDDAEQRARQHPATELARRGVGRAPAHQRADPTQRGRDARRAARGQRRQRDQHRGLRLRRAKRARRHRVQKEGDARELRHVGRRLVAELQQAERCDQRQQGAVGNGARIVDRISFTAESEGQRLGRFGACEVVGAVPGQHQHQRQQDRERDACGQRWTEPGAEQFHEHRAEPVRQQRAVGGQTGHRRREPGAASLRQVDHVAEGRDVGVLPRVAAEHAGQHIGRAEQQQCASRQPLRSALGDEGGVGGVQVGERVGARMMQEVWPTKKAAGAAFMGWRNALYFLPRCANLLRNFSTRPPNESTLFCVPV